jgi:hypothetical protein
MSNKTRRDAAANKIKRRWEYEWRQRQHKAIAKLWTEVKKAHAAGLERPSDKAIDEREQESALNNLFGRRRRRRKTL